MWLTEAGWGAPGSGSHQHWQSRGETEAGLLSPHSAPQGLQTCAQLGYFFLPPTKGPREEHRHPSPALLSGDSSFSASLALPGLNTSSAPSQVREPMLPAPPPVPMPMPPTGLAFLALLTHWLLQERRQESRQGCRFPLSLLSRFELRQGEAAGRA